MIKRWSATGWVDGSITYITISPIDHIIQEMHSGRYMYTKLNVRDYIVTDRMSEVTK